MAQETIIEVSNVKRQYTTTEGFFKKKKKVVEAIKGLSFSVKKGEIFGLLGPNGAGKTTMIKILTTMLTPTEGHLSILGLDPVKNYKELRPQINFILGGERNLYWRLSAYDNLAYFADLYKVPRMIQKQKISRLLDLVGLNEAAYQKVETFSKGMKQRLQIARGLINDPKILFLDEPSIGLDPVSARNLRDIILQLNQQGTTILLTTHYMFEADELCDRIAFVNKGELIAIDTPQNLKERTSDLSIIEFKVMGGNDQKIESLSRLASVHHVQKEVSDYKVTIRLHSYDPQETIPYIYESLREAAITDLAISKPTLEDVYIKIVGGQAS